MTSQTVPIPDSEGLADDIPLPRNAFLQLSSVAHNPIIPSWPRGIQVYLNNEKVVVTTDLTSHRGKLELGAKIVIQAPDIRSDRGIVVFEGPHRGVRITSAPFDNPREYIDALVDLGEGRYLYVCENLAYQFTVPEPIDALTIDKAGYNSYLYTAGGRLATKPDPLAKAGDSAHPLEVGHFPRYVDSHRAPIVDAPRVDAVPLVPDELLRVAIGYGAHDATMITHLADQGYTLEKTDCGYYASSDTYPVYKPLAAPAEDAPA